MEAGQQQFACQHSGQIGSDAESGDAKEHEGQSQQQGGHILQEGGCGSAEPV